MSEKVGFSPDEASVLEEGGVVTKETPNGWAAFYVTKGVSRHACTFVFGETEEKAREAVSSQAKKAFHGLRADGSHFC